MEQFLEFPEVPGSSASWPGESAGRASTFRYVSLERCAAAYGVDVQELPFVIRILLENVQRHRLLGKPVSRKEVAALVRWQEHTDAQLSLHVERVILPDSSGLPVLQDLAALRDAVLKHGGNPAKVDTRIPVDLIVDHSLQVDAWGSPDAVRLNMEAEFSRNAERYRFLKWCQQAFAGLTVYPPGTGIIHQVNLEKLATVVNTNVVDGEPWARPDFVIGGDSHTPMVNGMGVLGWGVGGIDAESALLGRAYTFPIPRVIGVELVGSRNGNFTTTTDLALLVTERLRAENVAGCAVEFFGSAIEDLQVTDRATIANMAPEYGATCGFFPVDDNTLAYLRLTGRSEDAITRIEHYCKLNSLWGGASAHDRVRYSRVIQINLDKAQACMAGPRRPQDRLPISQIKQDFTSRLFESRSEGGFGADDAASTDLPEHAFPGHGGIVLAAITSCTNTSNPSVMVTAALIARAARQRGITPPPWVKRSLAPGSRTVTDYLQKAGLLDDMEAMGFHVIGYGCTTCGGKSGPLVPGVAQDIEANKWVACTVLSGNRNFEGRIHKMARANYIGSPALVMAYALAGRINIDLTSEPVAHDADGKPVWLHELWPEPEEVQQTVAKAVSADTFITAWRTAPAGHGKWSSLDGGEGMLWSWDTNSSYLVHPPFFQNKAPDTASFERQLCGARVLGLFGDSLTTDHISPSGEIPADSPAGKYMLAQGIAAKDFNTYVARRGNFEVMTRATFANLRIRNLLVQDVEGGYTLHFPSGEQMSTYDASRRYLADGISTIVLAGKEYGTGSSRDWAAKGTALLGVRAVIAKSFERIHRANLVGMGILPLAFAEGEGWAELGLDGTEVFDFRGTTEALEQDTALEVTATHPSGKITRFQARPQVLTESERELLLQGGIPTSVLQDYLTH